MYRQCVGIPMGTEFSALLANLFLFYYEYNYVYEELRYIDDLLTLNNTK